MENAGTVVFGFYLLLLDGIVAAALLAAAVLCGKRGKAQENKKYCVLRLVCLVFGVVCAIPVAFVAGYLLYFYVCTRFVALRGS